MKKKLASSGISGTVALAAPHRGENRHERRRAEALAGKKNTKGFPVGFNAKTWSRYNTGDSK